jgi:hypothetical protein
MVGPGPGATHHRHDLDARPGRFLWRHPLFLQSHPNAARVTARGSDFAELLRRVKTAGLLRRRPGYYLTKIALVAVRNADVHVGCQVRACHPQPIVRRVLEVTGLLDVLTVEQQRLPADPQHPPGPVPTAVTARRRLVAA